MISATKLAIFVLALSSAIFVGAQSNDNELRLGAPVERELKGGEKHSYHLTLAADQFVHVVAEQNGIDVVVRLLGETGETLIKIDANGVRGPEPLWYVAKSSARFTIEVEPVKENAKAGKYEIKVAVLRPATVDDVHLAAAEKLAGEAFALVADTSDAARLQAKEHSAAAAILLEKIERDLEAKAGGFKRLGALYRAFKSNGLALKYFDNAAYLYEQADLKREAMLAVTASLPVVSTQADAIARNEKVIKFAKEIGDRKAQLSGMIEIAKSYYYLGDFSRSEQTNVAAMVIARDIGDRDRVGRIFDNMGSIYTAQGNLRAALEAHQKALEIATEIKNDRSIPGTILNIGNVYTRLGNYELAIDSYKKALADFEKMRAPVGIAYATSNIGSVYLEKKDYDTALTYFLKAQPMKAAFLPNDPTSFYNIASVYRGTGRLNEAMDYTRKSLELCKKTADRHCTATAMSHISDTYLEMRDYENAAGAANEALDISKRNVYRDVLSSAYVSLAKAQLGLEKGDQAARSLENAIAVLDELRSELTVDEENRGRFFEIQGSPYRMLIQLLASKGSTEEAFALAERLKARVLLDVLANGKVNITSAMTPKEREKEASLQTDLVELNSQMTKTSEEPKRREIAALLKKKRLEFEDFSARLYAAHPELKAKRGEARPISATDTTKLLENDKSALLEFVVVDDKSYLFVITKGPSSDRVVKSYTIDITHEALATRVETFRSKLAAGDLSFATDSRDLYGLLLKPAEAQLKGKTNLIIVPDDVLWNLPFQSLSSSTGRFLIETAAVAYAPSLSALSEMKKKARARRPTGELLAFGNPSVGKQTAASVKRVFMNETLEPLPEAERLVNSLRHMYGEKNSRVFVGTEASEHAAKLEATKYRVVQFAAHAVLNDSSPMYSHIVLSQSANGEREDGLLEAWEIKDLGLNADMFILSGCETARGKVSRGEGMIGMTWAAFIAGAPTTVASQWKVESSSTTEYMLEFHRQMLVNKKISKAEALRRASLKLIRSEKYRHPSYWGPWVLVGDGS